MTQNIGIIGITGRMGSVLAEMIRNDKRYNLGTSISQSITHQVSIDRVFLENDYVIDFSFHEYTPYVIEAALLNPKPLVLCTTNWDQQLLFSKIELLATKTRVVIAPNTSIGSCLQRYFVRKLAEHLDSEYDIDIIERHHRNKIDSPSGTAISFISDIQNIKKTIYNLEYDVRDINGRREDNMIYVASERAGNLSGEHVVSFINAYEEISIQHRSLNRSVYAYGAIKAIEWIAQKQENGLFSMMDVFGLS